MKNLPLILSGILSVAVIVLFYLHFSSSKSNSSTQSQSSNGSALSIPKVAIVNWDSIQEKDKYFLEKVEILKNSNIRASEDLQRRMTHIQEIERMHQQNINNYTLTQQQAAQQELMEKGQNFQAYEQSLKQQLATQTSIIEQGVTSRIIEFIEKYAKENGIEVVLRKRYAGEVLFSDEPLDITTQVIEGLNKKYDDDLKAKSDSTATK